uniref:Uncharacterized protein n=1 Tax=Solanum lycopersicum TaxID=4081 RepID=A0A3Q7FWT0_SOLLC
TNSTILIVIKGSKYMWYELLSICM